MAANISSDSLEPVRKPGRPRAIPCDMEEVVTKLYNQGNGYRKISNILGIDYGVSAHYTTVKRLLKRMGVLAL